MTETTLPAQKGSWRRAVTATLLLVAAFCLQRAATGPWASTLDASGNRIVLSPSGISRITPSGSVDCRWWPTYGDAAQCGASSGDSAGHFQRVKWAYPLLLASLWGAIGALFLVVLRVPRRNAVRVIVSTATASCALLAIIVMQLDAPVGLAALEGLHASFREVGAWFARAGAVGLLVSAGLQLRASNDVTAGNSG